MIQRHGAQKTLVEADLFNRQEEFKGASLFLNPFHRYICLVVLGPAEMDPSKIGSEECSSSESGWTTYIASPDLLEHEYADRNNEDDDDDDNDVNIARKGFKKVEQEEAAADSDDSMASDASSGPSDQYGYIGRSHGGLSHVGSNNQRKAAAKKQEEKKKQIKGEKDKSGNSAGRLKKF
ncbi:hypothetical protein SASPL_140457 [Salvia splendens]|uniref:Uncharacterized protein n=1 Tax=Salvia splendens TaxID=180675 RepID=A0A8X8WNV3_SALSN|nr:hypothetical protein SASPL_140457 [Salvia splendens]